MTYVLRMVAVSLFGIGLWLVSVPASAATAEAAHAGTPADLADAGGPIPSIPTLAAYGLPTNRAANAMLAMQSAYKNR